MTELRPFKVWVEGKMYLVKAKSDEHAKLKALVASQIGGK